MANNKTRNPKLISRKTHDALKTDHPGSPMSAPVGGSPDSMRPGDWEYRLLRAAMSLLLLLSVVQFVAPEIARAADALMHIFRK